MADRAILCFETAVGLGSDSHSPAPVRVAKGYSLRISDLNWCTGDPAFDTADDDSVFG